MTPAVIEVGDEDHTHADTEADSQFLRSGFTGAARILWKEPSGTDSETGQKLAIIEIGPANRDRFPARLTGAAVIDGRTFGWLYSWEEVRLDADPGSATFAEYVVPPEGSGALSSDEAPERLAFNRYEAHLSVIHAQPGDGIEGFANAGACVVPGVLETCTPVKAVVPFLRPIPKGVVVEMRAERTLQGETRFVFDAMTPIEFREMTVPQELYA